jgi:antigen 43
VWRRLQARAAEIGMVTDTADLELTDDTDLHLMTETGIEIRPAVIRGNSYVFVVAKRFTTGLRIVSRKSRPSDTIGPFVDDRRMLGVRVGRITCRTGDEHTSLNMHQSDTAMSGWHSIECGSLSRWTDGDAVLPLDLSVFPIQTAFLLDIEIVAGGPYPATGSVSVTARDPLPAVAA